MVPCLPFEADGAVDSPGDGGFFGQMGLKETGRVTPSAAQIIAPETFGDGLRFATEFAGQVSEKQFRQVRQRDAVLTAHLCEKPVAETQEHTERRGTGRHNCGVVSIKFPLLATRSQ